MHHTVTANRPPHQSMAAEREAAVSLAKSIQRDHMNRERPGRDTLQNFTVSRGGLVLEGRHRSASSAREGKLVVGGHTRIATVNRTHFGIEVEGTYHVGDLKQILSLPQMDALVEVCAWLAYWGDFQSSAITGHKDHQATQCPGQLHDTLAQLRLDVRARKLEIIEALGERTP